MYKYMNNHFGYSRIFSKARFKTPGDSLESGDGTGLQSGGGGASSETKEEPNGVELTSPTNEELLEKIAQSEIRMKQIEAEAERQKLENNRLASEKEKLKTQLAAKMTAEEQIDEAKKEAEEARNKRFEEMENELSVIKATKRYMTIEMNEEKAEETAKAEISGDMEKVISNIGIHIKELKKVASEEALNKFLAERPDIKAGNGEGDKISLAEEKAKEFIPRKRGSVNADALKRFM